MANDTYEKALKDKHTNKMRKSFMGYEIIKI